MSEPALQTEPLTTWRDFVALPDDDRRELVDGELLALEVPTDLHEHIVLTIGFFLKLWARPRRALVMASNYRVRISPRRGFLPDVQLYLAGNPARGQQQGLEHGHPDLAVEVVSQGPGGCEAEPGETRSVGSVRHDRVLKRESYARIGVPEYWIVDPEARIIERLVLRDGFYSIAQAGSDSEIFMPASFEGLEIPLAELWVLP
jgi:Uma2 family endonuclease